MIFRAILVIIPIGWYCAVRTLVLCYFMHYSMEQAWTIPERAEHYSSTGHLVFDFWWASGIAFPAAAITGFFAIVFARAIYWMLFGGSFIP